MAMPILQPDQIYQLLRNLTSPVVAITSARGGKRNGMIADSAVRASIVPAIPRVSVYIHKFNFSHDLIFDTGLFVLHLLRDDQFELIHRLGFTSGRARDKLDGVPHRLGTLAVPVLDDCYAHFECRVANVMDTGSSTCFLGDVVEVGHGAAGRALGSVMTAAHFRANMPAEWRAEYEGLLGAAQTYAAERSRDIGPVVWKGPKPGGDGERKTGDG
jgi:flavin reductase (DIM6/NTAB) family NADH-FMN oxidoreductase RutF